MENLHVFVYYDCDAAHAMIRSTVKLGDKYYLVDGEGSLISEGYDTMCPITARNESSAMSGVRRGVDSYMHRTGYACQRKRRFWGYWA